MPSQVITLIAVPNGFGVPDEFAVPDEFTGVDGAGRARLSVYLSPQLQPDAAGVLAPFDFVDWPSRFRTDWRWAWAPMRHGVGNLTRLDTGTIRFEVGVGEARIEAKIVSRPESRLWQALFDTQTFVRAHTPDVVSSVFGSYPAARIHDLIKSGYQELGVESPLDATAQDRIPAAFLEVGRLFGASPEELLVDDPALDEHERRARLAQQLFQPGSADEVAERLVDLAQSESGRTRSVGAAPAFCPIVPDRRDAASTLAQFLVYHRQSGGTRRILVNQAPADGRLDFHQLLTALTEYPELLRLLGLVIDVEFDPDGIPEAASDAPGLLRVIPHFTSRAGVETAFLTPDTAYVLEPGRVFAAAPARPGDRIEEAVSGLLNLHLPVASDPGEDQFRIVQVDLDGGGLHALDRLARALSPRATPGEADGGPFTLPPLRSGGISITREGHAPFLHAVLTSGRMRMAALAAGEAATLFGDDLIRGIRVDVGDPATGTWHSLHEREGTYRFIRAQEERQIGDEGCVQPTLAQPDVQRAGPRRSTLDDSLPNYVSESLFLWQGWSLSAPRPVEPLPFSEEPPATSPSVEGGGLGLEVAFRPRTGSLPRLRFGQRYMLRARMVDLAGNALDLGSADRVMAALGTDAPVLPRRTDTADGDRTPDPRSGFRFLRFEVVPSPLVVPRVDGHEGESVERVVIRSNHDQTPEAFATLHAASHPEYALSGERHLAPPGTWQLLAEMSGCFDAAIGTATDQGDRDRMRDLAIRERDAPRTSIQPAATMSVDWLPDPLAAGASFRGLPGVAEGTAGRAGSGGLDRTELPLPPARSSEVGSVVTVDFGPSSSWPDLSSFRLRLVEGAGSPAWNATERVLTVALPKGDRATVRVACHLHDEAALELLGIWSWIVEELHLQVESGHLAQADLPGRVEELRQLSLLGLSRLLTPYRELTLVHAVQQPIETPVILSFDPVRFASSTFTYTRGRVQVHLPSTGTIELTARWTEKVDDLQARPPADVEFEAPVFATPFALPDPGDTPIPAPADDSLPAVTFDADAGVVIFPGPGIGVVGQALAAAVQELGSAGFSLIQAFGGSTGYDVRVASITTLAAEVPIAETTLHQLSSEAALLEQRAQEELADFNAPDLPEPTPPAVFGGLEDIARTAADVARGAEGALAELFTLQRHRGRHEFGDTKYRRVCYEVVATTRFGECFDPDDDSLDLTRTSDCAIVDVLSSSPPAPPGIQYIVPAVSWTRTGTRPDSSEFTSQRHGGILRVYLDRPWHSSGDGELLGVVVASRPEAEEILRQGRATATQIGRDPQWVSPRAKSMPTPADFRNTAATHQPSPSHPTAVLGFRVEFDQRGRCFSDIELAPADAYYPFVRLALVRLQPNSLPGMAVSPTVFADFAQVVPDRAVTVARRADDHFAVTVTGPTHESPTTPSDPSARGTRIRVGVQEHIPGTDDDAGWLPADEQATITTDTAAPTGPVLWSGTVTLPAGRVSGRFRILIEEIETYRGLDPMPSQAGGVLIDRVVFADTVVL